MKCLVFSDSHGYTLYMKKAIGIHPDAEVIFFLGDGLREIDALSSEYPEKFFVAVAGNCDFYSFFKGEPARKTETITVGGYRITATHGDLYGAKYGCGGLIKLAMDTDSDIVLLVILTPPLSSTSRSMKSRFISLIPGAYHTPAAHTESLLSAVVRFFRTET